MAVPITFVNHSTDLPDVNDITLNAKDAQTQADCKWIEDRRQYVLSLTTSDNPITFHGMPVGIQIMCRRAEEEVALSLAGIISELSQQDVYGAGRDTYRLVNMADVNPA